MTISAIGVRAVYIGSGSSGPFTLQDGDAQAILFVSNSEIRVTKYSAAGVPTVLTITTDYSLTGAGSPTAGSLTTVSPVAVGETLVIERVTPRTQTLDLITAGFLRRELIESLFDKLVRILQEDNDRAIKMVNTYTGDDILIPAPTANNILGWNAAGDELENKIPNDGSVLSVSPFMETLLDDADASTARTTLGLAIGSNVQAFDADLSSIAALSTTAYGRSLLTLANAGALATEVDASFLTPAEGNAAYQPLDADLTAIAALTTTAFGRSVLAAVNAAALATLAGLGTGSSPVFTNLGMTGYTEMTEMAEPGSPAANVARIYARDVSGVTTPFYKDSTGRERVWPGAFFDARDFGLGDGTTENTAAINAAIAAANAAGGGTVFIPAGSFTVINTATSDAIIMASNVRLMGAGIGATTLTLGNAQEAQVISIASDNDVEVCDLSINGNRANQTTQVHGIRLSETTRCIIQRVKITDAEHYGIGAQAGTMKDVTIKDVSIINVGGDGIDFKNDDDDNSNIVIDNVLVDGWGLNTALTVQAGVDIRGPAKLSRIHCRNPGDTDCRGIRFRPGELLDANGLGGHESTLSQFLLEMSGATATGLSIEARSVYASQGIIKGTMALGVYMNDDRPVLNQIEVRGAGIGFHFDALGGGFDARRGLATNCFALSCTTNSYKFTADDCSLVNCWGNDAATNILIDSAADSTRIIGGGVVGAGTAEFTDNNGNTVVWGVNGITTNTLSILDDTANAGGTLDLFRDSASPAANDALWQINFRGRDSAAGSAVYAGIDARILDPTNGSEDGELRLRARIADSNTVIASVGNGVQVGAPTGGYKGAGTLNAVQVFDDNVLLTDYVFDRFLEDYKVPYSDRVREAAAQLDAAMFDPASYEAYWREHRRLPGMPDLNDCIDGIVKEHSLGAMIQKLWQTVELQAIHNAKLLERIEALERTT
jgi:hypothetical protein